VSVSANVNASRRVSEDWFGLTPILIFNYPKCLAML
jgi:hypothetical protein